MCPESLLCPFPETSILILILVKTACLVIYSIVILCPKHVQLIACVTVQSLFMSILFVALVVVMNLWGVLFPFCILRSI